jgi:hypothetical protein
MSINMHVAKTQFHKKLLQALWMLGGRASVGQIARRFKMNENDVAGGFDCLGDAVVRIKDETYALGIKTEEGYIPESVLVQLGDALHRYGDDSLELVLNVLVPEARTQGVSLIRAAWNHADDGADQDTSYYQLYVALLHVPGHLRRVLDDCGAVL